jgi:glycerophosphoryl diester phosphodiesterase
MLIIGHRGAAGLAPENTIEAFQAGIEAGADILEFDVQRTRDGELVVIHDSTLFRTHKKSTIVRWSTMESIKRATEKGHHIATLEEVMDRYFGKILLNLEIKNIGIAKHIVRFIESRYIQKDTDWDAVLFSSFKPTELITVRKMNQRAQLALLHDKNPFLFMVFHRRLDLSAVGFHRLRAPSIAVAAAKQLQLFTYVYTVNLPEATMRASEAGIDAIVTDNPIALRPIVDGIL